MTVKLIQIDSRGDQVGAVLATASTDANGSYTLTTPPDFVPGPSYVVQAEAPSGTIQGFVTGAIANIDPYTQTTVNLVTESLGVTGASITSIAATDVVAVQQTILADSDSIALSALREDTT